MISWSTYKYFRDNTVNVPTTSAKFRDEIKNENEQALKGSILFPTRWYTAQPNFVGKHVKTDISGFRIDTQQLRDLPSIGFFGGSTMWSVATGQDDTIPSLVRHKNYNSLNFGQGGYSTTAEIATFIEAIRKYPNIEIAVFYDGVNEVGRYLEYIQDHEATSAFTNVGYYSPWQMNAAIANLNSRSTDSIELHFEYHSPFLGLLDKVITRFRRDSNIKQFDIEKASSEIVDLYFKNVDLITKLASNFNVTPIFILQPNIFTSGKPLSETEKAIIQRDRSLLPNLTRRFFEKAVSDPRAEKLKIIDLTKALDNTEASVYIDWCHLTEQGNEAIADAIEINLNIIDP